MTATEKQVRYAMSLLAQAGYNTGWMSAEHKRWGATMRERSGSVEGWLKSMDFGRISRLIDDLKEDA